MKILQADRLKALPPYLFAEIDRMKAEVAAKGIDIISLGIGDPDLPTLPNIIDRMKKAVDNPIHHQYPSYEGMPSFRKAVAKWYGDRFSVDLDPVGEVVSLIGSKEGIAHAPLAFINPGDVVLCPDPGYPVYSIGTMFAGGEAYLMPLLEENLFLPDLSAIPADILDRAKLMFLNYPNNPTSAGATREFFEKVVAFARQNNILVCHDAAYSEVYYDGELPMSFLEIPGADEVGIEFHSFSKTYNMTGWRIGWVCGNQDAIGAIGKIKTNIDSGIFQAIQEAGIEALQGDQEPVEELRKIYQSRRDLACGYLSKSGFSFMVPKATFYLWVGTPEGLSSAQFVGRILQETGVVLTPGNGFGVYGEGYFRISLTVNEDRLQEALDRIGAVSW
ncbi:MAG: LL-diaminopimelate aminotransferase [bacterium]|nr:LL-diaminopimelate aminotransferase [bacterium]MDT8365048.1 LL-diaminopimelate aminotransferase [bacterium]